MKVLRKCLLIDHTYQMSHHPCVTMDQGLLMSEGAKTYESSARHSWFACTYSPENQTEVTEKRNQFTAFTLGFGYLLKDLLTWH